MMIRLAGTCLLPIFLLPHVLADERREAVSSPQLRAAGIVDRFDLQRRSLDREFDAAVRQAAEHHAEQLGELREKVIKQLDKELQAAIKASDLDAAVRLRDKIQTIKNQPAVIATRPLAKTIEGTWRWGNGATIRNLPDGRTNGNGTWRLVDASTQTYQFDWKKIPADRVKMSANGQILEGSKINQPNIRVWAVRIDDERSQPQIADSASR